jgi:hypothetical protein
MGLPRARFDDALLARAPRLALIQLGSCAGSTMPS